MNLIAVKNRFMFGFGMMSREYVSDKEELIMLDTWNLSNGWEKYYVKSDLPKIGCQYGFFPLNTSSTYSEFLVFGGIDSIGSDCLN